MQARMKTLGVAAVAVAAAASVAVLRSRAADTAKEKRLRGYVQDIDALTTANQDFRHVLYTGRHMQLVLMTLRPGEDIGEEVHKNTDQFFRVEKGRGEAWIDDVRSEIKDGSAVFIPAGARHNIKNTGDQPLRLYTLYAPPEHQDGTVRATKAAAAAEEEHFDGKTTE